MAQSTGPSSEGEIALPPSAPAPEAQQASPAPTAAAPAVTSGDPFAIGTVLGGKYRIERLLGEGGLGVVMLATHVQLDRPVAIKYLQSKALSIEAVVERFTREGRLAAMLRSEHVVRLHDVAVLEIGEQRHPYLVMEYLDGQDLSDAMRYGPPPIMTSVDYLIQACDALAEAHAKGIVHRDLKPANLFITRAAGGKTVLKVLDFGISKLSERLAGSARRLTTANDRFGTPAYMPPEQLATASKVDPRSDIWALGVILYELFSDRLPFEGETMSELCVAIGTHPPNSLAAHRPDLPPDLERIVLRCLEKEPEDRFQNVGELAQELAPFASARMRPLVDQIAEVVMETGSTIRPPMSSGTNEHGGGGGFGFATDPNTRVSGAFERHQHQHPRGSIPHGPPTIDAPKTPATPSAWNALVAPPLSADSQQRLWKMIAALALIALAVTVAIVVVMRAPTSSSASSNPSSSSAGTNDLQPSGAPTNNATTTATTGDPSPSPSPSPSLAAVAAAPTTTSEVAPTTPSALHSTTSIPTRMKTSASAAPSASTPPPSASASTDRKKLLLTR